MNNNMSPNQKSNSYDAAWSGTRSKIKAKWSKFTDSDIDAFQGHLDQIVGRVQQVYGVSKDRAEREFSEIESSLQGPSSGGLAMKSGDRSTDKSADKPTDRSAQNAPQNSPQNSPKSAEGGSLKSVQ